MWLTGRALALECLPRSNEGSSLTCRLISGHTYSRGQVWNKKRLHVHEPWCSIWSFCSRKNLKLKKKCWEPGSWKPVGGWLSSLIFNSVRSVCNSGFSYSRLCTSGMSSTFSLLFRYKDSPDPFAWDWRPSQSDFKFFSTFLFSTFPSEPCIPVNWNISVPVSISNCYTYFKTPPKCHLSPEAFSDHYSISSDSHLLL